MVKKEIKKKKSFPKMPFCKYLQDRTTFKTKNNTYFATVQDIHPKDGFAALPVYLQDNRGNRIIDGLCYRTIKGREITFLAEKLFKRYLVFSPQLKRKIYIVPKKDVEKILDPKEKLKKIMAEKNPKAAEKRDLIEFVRLIIKNSKIKLSDMGIVGSFLLNATRSTSDMDLCIYGKKKTIEIKSCLSTLFKKYPNLIKKMDKKYFQDRWKKESKKKISFMPFNKFIFHQERKMQGLFRERPFLFIGTRTEKEINKEKIALNKDVQPLTDVEVIGEVIDDCGAMFGPSYFKLKVEKIIKGPKIKLNKIDVWNFLPSLADQVRLGERVRISGKLEKINNSDYRIIIIKWDNNYYNYTINIT